MLAISPKLLVAALVWASAGAVAVLRADPPNPLRPSEFTSGAIRIVPLPTSAQAVTKSLAVPSLNDDEPQPEIPSIVENRLSQPELIPAPGPSASEMSDYFGPPDLNDPAPWQHMAHPLFAEPWFSHADPNDPDRHIGIGQPLIGTSWRNRPLYFGTFVGGIMMDDLVPGRIYQNDTTFVGLRLGYDFDHFWGLEGRWAFARPDLANGATGAPFFPASRDNFADVSLAFYPLGDTRWRPYLLAGLGFQTFRFNNELGQRISEAPLEIPLGAGIKYFYGPWFTLRFDFVDNLSLGNARISGMNNISFMTGAEFRFGGRRPSYFPWHSNTTYW
ncbi:MAG TPA: outer membrane beta-barrel protein [Pirellulaceae bacterium]